MSISARSIKRLIEHPKIGEWAESELAFAMQNIAGQVQDLERELKAKRAHLRKLAVQGRKLGWSDAYIGKVAKVSRVAAWQWRNGG